MSWLSLNKQKSFRYSNKETSAVIEDDARPYLPPRATRLLWLLKQAVGLHEAIFTRFPAAWSATTNVSVKKLVGRAFCHLRPPTENLWTQSSPTCVRLAAQSYTRWKRKRIERPLCPGSAPVCRKFTPLYGLTRQWCWATTKIVMRTLTVWGLTQETSTRRFREIPTLKQLFT